MSDSLDGFAFDDGAWFERPGLRIVTRGSRRTLLVPPGQDQLERLADAVRDALEPGEIAIGAIGFDRGSQIILEIPERSHVERDPIPLTVPEPRQPPRRLRLEGFPSPERFEHAVATATNRIRDGALDKVVLARMLVAHADEPYDRHRLLRILSHREPASTRFAVGGFIGATPELLVARHGVAVRSQPLAGTRAKTAPDAASLRASAKDRLEHAIVAETVRDQLAPLCADLRASAEPGIVETASLLHLATTIEATLRDPATSALDVLAAIHPTPAIAGMPRDAALAAIAELEPFDRTRYGGAVGWIDAAGDGEWMLTLRCAEVRGRIAMCFAGAGIVADSDPIREREETDAKFAPMLRALEAC